MEEKNNSGYNSSDEYNFNKNNEYSNDRERKFLSQLWSNGLLVIQVKSDGACLFRAVSLLLVGTENAHNDLRKLAMTYIKGHSSRFKSFLLEDVDGYINRKGQANEYANNVELAALSEMFGRPIEVYSEDQPPIVIFNEEVCEKKGPILRLSYHCNSHYNALVEATLLSDVSIKDAISALFLNQDVNGNAAGDQADVQLPLPKQTKKLKKKLKSVAKRYVKSKTSSAESARAPSPQDNLDDGPSTSHAAVAAFLRNKAKLNDDKDSSDDESNIQPPEKKRPMCTIYILSGQTEVPDSTSNLDDDDKPCTSAQALARLEAAKTHSMQTSSQARQAMTLYQELLLSTIDANGRRLTEDEMLQRALELSAQECVNAQHDKESETP